MKTVFRGVGAFGVILALCLGAGVNGPNVWGCDWDVPAGSQVIEVPVRGWHTAPEGKKLVRLTYSVGERSLNFNSHLESKYPFLGAAVMEIIPAGIAQGEIRPRHMGEASKPQMIVELAAASLKRLVASGAGGHDDRRPALVDTLRRPVGQVVEGGHAGDVGHVTAAPLLGAQGGVRHPRRVQHLHEGR